MSIGKGAFTGALGEADTGGGVASVLNPEGVDLLVTRLLIDVTTKTDAACTLDAGPAAAATTLSDTLIDGLDVNSAVGLFDNIKNQAGSGLESERWESDEYLTISVKTGAGAGLVGNFFVEYLRA